MKRIALAAFVTLAFVAFLQGSAMAQASRTWVSGVGDDANPCSRTAPCKTFAGAISKTSTGGEIDCLDPGGFGGLTITKSITIDCSGTLGSVLVAGTNGITINSAGANVAIRGLAVNGIGSGLVGISDLSSGSLLLENVRVFGFTGVGVSLQAASGTLQVDIKDTTVYQNAGGGIMFNPASGAATTASLTRVAVYKNLFGIRSQDGANVSVYQSTVSNNVNSGFIALSASTAANMTVVDSIAANNGSGFGSNGSLATVTVARSAIFGNTTGIANASGTVATTNPATNVNAGNPTPGTPNGTTNLQ